MKSVKATRAGSAAARAVRPDGEQAADLMGWLLKRVSRTVTSEDHAGLRSSHYRLLKAVPPQGIAMAELGTAVGMTAQGSGQFVRYLVGTGHLSVGVDETDRRVRIVRRTLLGDDAVEAITARLDEMESEWAALVGPRRYATFRAVLAELTGTHEPI